MKIHTIVMLLVAILFVGTLTVAQTKEAAKSDKKESCCMSQTKGTADKSKDCCKDAKQTAGKTECTSKDGKKMAGCDGAMKSDCCAKDGKKAEATSTSKDKGKK